MMDRARFVAAGRPRWARLEVLLGKYTLADGASWSELSDLYRGVCADLSRARGLDDHDDVRVYLDDLAGRAHNRMYGTRRRVTVDVVRYVAQDVPAQVRASWRWVLLASALFYVPGILCMLGAYVSPEFAAQVLDEGTLSQMEEAYSVAPDDRPVGEAAMMAGFYVYNNVSIAFRCFATGVMGGLGSVFFLVYNGAVIGTVFGHLALVGNGWNLLGFVSGHSAWELTGIVVAGAGGLRMGWALIDTGGLTRTASLRRAGPELFRLVVAAALMLGVAAAIEGFWSASPVPVGAKYAFGVLQVVLVVAWLGLSGRGRA